LARSTGWVGEVRYLPAARRCQRVRFNIFLCFFFRIRLRRFLISDPMAGGTLVEDGQELPIGALSARWRVRPSVGELSGGDLCRAKLGSPLL